MRTPRQPAGPAFTLPLERVLEDRNFSLRLLFGDLDALAVQLMAEGQREPIRVREDGGQFFVIDGHRRQRAFARSLQLRIVAEDGRHIAYDGVQPLRDAPGPVHPRYDPRQVLCELCDSATSREELFARQVLSNRGKPYTTLERSLFLSRLLRQGGDEQERFALRLGFSDCQIAQARELHAADPRLLDLVREGRVSPPLALRLLRSVPPQDQMERLKAARAEAEREHRDQLVAHDFAWAEPADEAEAAPAQPAVDPVHARLRDVVARLGDAVRFAPNRAAEDRLGTLLLIHRYAVGQVEYERLEAHLLGRQ